MGHFIGHILLVTGYAIFCRYLPIFGVKFLLHKKRGHPFVGSYLTFDKSLFYKKDEGAHFLPLGTYLLTKVVLRKIMWTPSFPADVCFMYSFFFYVLIFCLCKKNKTRVPIFCRCFPTLEVNIFVFLHLDTLFPASCLCFK